jgi:hypothetical protein
MGTRDLNDENDGQVYARSIRRRKLPEYCALGLFCIVTGGGAIWIARDYPYGTLTAMGPGFVPTAIAAILALLGIVILLLRGSDVCEDERKKEPGETMPRRAGMPLDRLRVLALITGGILFFGATLRGLGLAISTFVLVVLVSLAQPGNKASFVLLLATSITAAACILFIALLDLAIAVFPEF